jgi:membrane protease YdiL (CAAX protease family)
LDKFQLTAFSLILAISLWILVFVVRRFNFWAVLSLSTLLLMMISVFINRDALTVHLKARRVMLGILSGIALYLFFYAGYQVTKFSPLFSEGITHVYDFRGSASPLTIALLLIFPISPSEEVYWRGLIQRRFMERIGARSGYIFTAIAYSLVHLPTLNFPLILTAFIGGLVWGYLYKVTSSLVPAVISHVLFDLLIFVVAPFT